MTVWGGLTNSCEKKRSKSKGEKKRYTHLNAEFQRIARRDKKPSSVINAKKQRKTTEWERVEITSKNQRYQVNISRKNGLDKGQKWYRPNKRRIY